MTPETIRFIIGTAAGYGKYPAPNEPQEQAAVRLGNEIRDKLPEWARAEVPQMKGSGGGLFSALSQEGPPSYTPPGGSPRFSNVPAVEAVVGPAADAAGGFLSSNSRIASDLARRTSPQPEQRPTVTDQASGLAGTGNYQLTPAQADEMKGWGWKPEQIAAATPEQYAAEKSGTVSRRVNEWLDSFKEDIFGAGSNKAAQGVAIGVAHAEARALTGSEDPDDKSVARSMLGVLGSLVDPDADIDREIKLAQLANLKRGPGGSGDPYAGAKFALQQAGFEREQAWRDQDITRQDAQMAQQQENLVRKEREALRQNFMASLQGAAGGFADESGYLPGMGPDSAYAQLAQRGGWNFTPRTGSPVPTDNEIAAALAQMGAG